MNMKKNKWIPDIKTHIQAGAGIRAGQRVLYPINKISFIAARGRLLGFRISPIALLIIEPGMKYAFSLNGKQMALDEIYRLTPSLKDIAAETGQRIQRI